MPDWVFNTDTMTFSVKDREEQKKNRPSITLDIFETKYKREYWEVFRKYHYLNTSLNIAARTFVAYANGKLAGFCAVLPQPHPIRKHIWRTHRTVTLPDFQGVGIASAMQCRIADAFLRDGITICSVTSNRAMIASMKKSPLWKCVSVGRKQTRSGAISLPHQSGNRITASFEYIGRAAAPKRQDDKSINDNEHAR